jgi:hypothetical protein
LKPSDGRRSNLSFFRGPDLPQFLESEPLLRRSVVSLEDEHRFPELLVDYVVAFRSGIGALYLG